MSLANQDVVVAVAGGIRVGETAADLGVALAIASSLRNVPLASRLAAIGEVGLSGEIRRVPQIRRRIAEVSRLGFQRCLIPASAIDTVEGLSDGPELTPVATLSQAFDVAIPKVRRVPPIESSAVTT